MLELIEDGMEDEHGISARFTQELIAEFKEEILQNNLRSFEYDW